jgi:hypothetical protein
MKVGGMRDGKKEREPQNLGKGIRVCLLYSF